jgi:hypothetical protein
MDPSLKNLVPTMKLLISLALWGSLFVLLTVADYRFDAIRTLGMLP